MSENFKINYESVMDYANSLWVESINTSEYYADVTRDEVSTIVANKNANEAITNQYTTIFNLQNNCDQEKTNLETLAKKFKETDENCAQN